MSWSRTILKAVALTTVGFLIPVAIFLTLEYALSEFVLQPNWRTVIFRYLSPATGCSLLFLASSMTSSTPRKVVTFVQSLFLHGITFIVCFMAFVPIQHSKIIDLQSSRLGWIPFIAVLAVFVFLIVIGNMTSAATRPSTKPIAKSDRDK